MPIAKGAEEEDGEEEEELHREHRGGGTEVTENAGDENWDKGAPWRKGVVDISRGCRRREEMITVGRDKLAQMLTETKKFGFAVQSEFVRYNGLFLSGTETNWRYKSRVLKA